MKISVKVRPGAGEDRVKETGVNEFAVWVKERAQGGKANEAVIELLAEHFGVPQTQVRIVLGRTQRKKIIEIK